MSLQAETGRISGRDVTFLKLIKLPVSKKKNTTIGGAKVAPVILP